MVHGSEVQGYEVIGCKHRFDQPWPLERLTFEPCPTSHAWTYWCSERVEKHCETVLEHEISFCSTMDVDPTRGLIWKMDSTHKITPRRVSNRVADRSDMVLHYRRNHQNHQKTLSSRNFWNQRMIIRNTWKHGFVKRFVFLASNSIDWTVESMKNKIFFWMTPPPPKSFFCRFSS